MESQWCVIARRALRRAIQADRSSAFDPRVAAHIAGCESCRGALLLVVTELFGMPAAPPVIGCSQCLADLPAYVEHEDAGAPGEAARAFPHVWWHLWTCAECAETYDLTRMLVLAVQHGEISMRSAVQLVSKVQPRILSLLRLTRQFLNQALPPLAVARGDAYGPMVLSEGEAGAGHSFRLRVQAQLDATWLVEVIVTPPTKGWLVLTLGGAVYRAHFDPHGMAVVADVPAALLAAADGPDLAVGIELDEEPT
jgi:hypothetical protein